MRSIKLLGAALLALLIASPALAGAGSWVVCGSTRTASKNIGIGYCAAYEIDATDNDSMTFTFYVSNEALICLNPDSDTEGADDAQIMVHYCPVVPSTGTPDVNNCFDMLDSPLTGAVGDEDTQNACILVTRGSYWIEVTTAPGAGDATVISVFGK
jgi:hypothetical protein